MEKIFHLSLDLSLSHVFGFVAVALFFYMSLWSLAAIAKKRADLADIAWGPGFMLVAWTSLILGQATVDGLIINILVTIWAIRLAFHLYLRNRKRQEDFRYETLKQKWGKNLNLNLFRNVFLLQGCILYVIALPILWIHTHPQELPKHILWIGLLGWSIGFFLEAIADLQLALFKNDHSKKGKLLTTGLWGYVRHPNYLGELVQWWAIWFISASLPFGWALIISPLLLTFLIVKISGIKPLEEQMEKRAEFKAYVENTPSLIPPSLINGILYGSAWFLLIIYGSQSSLFFSIMIAAGCYGGQLWLLTKFDSRTLRSYIVLSIVALGLGFLQEMFFIYLKIVVYPKESIFPPLWLLALYPLFSLTLNSSLVFLNKSPTFTFLLGGFGALFSYLSGERLGVIQLIPPLAQPIIFLFWGLFLTILVIFNRKLRAWFSQR
ncbi:MAG TPA: hypothetical protein DCE71_02100 [Parachlamydiales bacterium]|nr:hypothetical protein [Parachlamydiales bacterium]